MARGRVLLDIGPLRESADYRRLFSGQVVSFLGTELTRVAVPVQVYELTGSSLAVGLVSLTQLGPLLVASLIGGVVVDSTDRRRLLLVTQVLMAGTSAGLALNSMGGEPALWPLFLLSSLAAAVSGFDRPARSAAIPSLLPARSLPAAYTLWQTHLQFGALAGPALAGVLLDRFGAATVYWIDAGTFAAAFLAAARIRPLRPVGEGTPTGLSAVVAGFRFVRGRRLLSGIFLADINAMVFGMPRAVFPELADRVFGGGRATVGLLYAAPGAGALVGALTMGWVNRVRRQGRAVILSVALWGAAIALFGIVPWLPVALVLLAVAGAADMVSAVFRNTMLQLSVPDALRGRMSAMHIAVVTGGPRLGDLEAGVVAEAAGARPSVVSGGVMCVAGILLLARWLPELASYDSKGREAETPATPHPPEAPIPEPPLAD